MEFRVLDEVVEIEGIGLTLFVAQEGSKPLYDGCSIRDIRGNVYRVDTVSDHEGLTCLLIRGGNADYFRRLFRNVLLDATLFTLDEAEARH